MTSTRLKEVGLKLFSMKGYEATSLADIAGEIGIKKPSIYAHFDSKLDLFLAIVAEVEEDYHACWKKVLKDTHDLPADMRLQELFRGVSSHFIQDRVKISFWVRLCLFPPEECHDAQHTLTRLSDTYVKEVTAICLQGVSAGLFKPNSPEIMAHSFFFLLDGYILRSVQYPTFDSLQGFTQVWQTFFQGIQK